MIPPKFDDPPPGSELFYTSFSGRLNSQKNTMSHSEVKRICILWGNG